MQEERGREKEREKEREREREIERQRRGVSDSQMDISCIERDNFFLCL